MKDLTKMSNVILDSYNKDKKLTGIENEPK